MRRVTLDFYNNTADVVIDDVQHLFYSTSRFKELTGFPFADAFIVSYEYERNFFMVERTGGVLVSGSSLPEIEWITDNIEAIKQAALTDISMTAPVPLGWREPRNTYLAATDWMVLRHNEQVLVGTTTLSAEQFTELLQFRNQLRMMTEESQTFPPVPAFVTVQL